MNYFTPAIGKVQKAKRNGFAGIFLIILVNDLLAAVAAFYVFGG